MCPPAAPIWFISGSDRHFDHLLIEPCDTGILDDRRDWTRSGLTADYITETGVADGHAATRSIDNELQYSAISANSRSIGVVRVLAFVVFKLLADRTPTRDLPYLNRVEIDSSQRAHLSTIDQSDSLPDHSTHVDGTVVLKEAFLVALPADRGPTQTTELMCDPGRTKGVVDHVILATVPGDLRFQRVDHHISMRVTDGAVARRHRHGTEWRAEFDREAGRLGELRGGADATPDTAYLIFPQ